MVGSLKPGVFRLKAGYYRYTSEMVSMLNRKAIEGFSVMGSGLELLGCEV
jgi:hypothetical protein